MKLLKLVSTLAAAALTTLSVSANAATYSVTGIIETCTGTCSIFTAAGETANFAWDGEDGPGPVTTAGITDVDISLSTPSGGALAFVNGMALASTLTANASSELTGGAVTLQATGATTGIVAQGELDFDTGTWTAFVVSAGDGSLQQIASGSITGGTIAPVPVPAAAWLFGTALAGLVGVGRNRRAS